MWDYQSTLGPKPKLIHMNWYLQLGFLVVFLFFQSIWLKWKDIPHLEVKKHNKQDTQLQVSLEAALWTQYQVKGTCQSMLSIRKSWIPVHMAG